MKIMEILFKGGYGSKKKSLYNGKILIPYFIYFDDAEINNPLGSHSSVHSIGAVYYSFPLFKNPSKLENIFVGGFLKSSDVKYYGNDPCFYKLIDEIKSLEIDGVMINAENGKSVNVHFILGLILGDNAGLNLILDFSKSFSANFFCRFCKENKESTKYLLEENSKTLRSIQNYTEDVLTDNATQTGVHNDSPFNKIPSFHVTKNLPL